MSWERVLDGTSTREELEAAIERQTAAAIRESVVQFDATATPAEQAAVLRLVDALIADRTRQALTAAWHDLQLEAAQAGGAVH